MKMASQTIGYVMGGAALLALNYWIASMPVSIEPIMTTAMAGGELPGSTALPGGSAKLSVAIDQTLLRPIFHTDRKPFQPIVETSVIEPPLPEPVPVQPGPVIAASPPVEPVDLSVLGISISAGGKFALLTAGGAQESVWREEGQAVEGWSIVSISPSSVSLLRDGAAMVLPLYPATASPGTTPDG